uniref:Secreted protein n=1 Tax=Ixodes ricinus TaxID=34613 RepID=A0A6B0URT9_IXORI
MCDFIEWELCVLMMRCCLHCCSGCFGQCFAASYNLPKRYTNSYDSWKGDRVWTSNPEKKKRKKSAMNATHPHRHNLTRSPETAVIHAALNARVHLLMWARCQRIMISRVPLCDLSIHFGRFDIRLALHVS